VKWVMDLFDRHRRKDNNWEMAIAHWLRRLFPRDWTPVGPPISSPDGKMVAIPMINYCIANPSLGRFVTLEVRTVDHKFMHAMQSGVAAFEHWKISWRDSNTIVVTGSQSGEWAFGVGIDSLYYPQRHPPYPGWTAKPV
jgi:hypothetical protein